MDINKLFFILYILFTIWYILKYNYKTHDIKVLQNKKFNSILSYIRNKKIHIKDLKNLNQYQLKNKYKNNIERFGNNQMVENKKIRVVVSYIPNQDIYIKELKILYQNFEYLNLWENTDLIIFHPKNFILSNTSKNKMHKLIMIQYDDVDEDNEWDGPIAANDCIGQCTPGKKLREKYSFINSFKFFIDPKIQNVLKKYKYILKTDSDIFLSPLFKYKFPDDKVLVGAGSYCNKNETKILLKKVAKKLNYNHYDIFNIGATWYW